MKFVSLFLTIVLFNFSVFAQSLDNPEELFTAHATPIHGVDFESLPMQDRGRIKPFHTFARESILFLTGSYKFLGMEATQAYLGLVGFSEIQRLKVINVRHTSVRKALGLKTSERFFSPLDLEKTALFEIANPLLEKQEKNSRSLEPNEKHILEIFNQYWFLKQINVGEHFLKALDANAQNEAQHGNENPSEVVAKGQEILRALMAGDYGIAHAGVVELDSLARAQDRPEILRGQVSHTGMEVTYNKLRPFFISALLFVLLGLALILKWPTKLFIGSGFYYLMPLPFIPLVIGFYMRVIITGFAPVTNMYGTMLWVSFGIGLFSSVIYFLYRKNVFVGGIWLAAAGILFLTESLPLILSPDLDPIVAVLRSNLWLTIHVLTIVISYAAFAIAMVLGNMVLIRSIVTRKYNDAYVQDAAKSCYRMIQLGVFLISVGIVLGGIWADYSWGRFWGWDPKETWALIADLGFLAILHARITGWIGAFGLLASSTVGFLLVIMAWYGVNFILAAGLHSYGFSSGGTAMVLTFVCIQMLVLGIALGLYWKSSRSRSAV